MTGIAGVKGDLCFLQLYIKFSKDNITRDISLQNPFSDSFEFVRVSPRHSSCPRDCGPRGDSKITSYFFVEKLQYVLFTVGKRRSAAARRFEPHQRISWIWSRSSQSCRFGILINLNLNENKTSIQLSQPWLAAVDAGQALTKPTR